MSTLKSSYPILRYPQSEVAQLPVGGAIVPLEKGDRPGAVIGRSADGFLRRFGAFARECWQDMSAMKAAFTQAASGRGARSRQRSEERLRDEEAWSRMDSEGCPNSGT